MGVFAKPNPIEKLPEHLQLEVLRGSGGRCPIPPLPAVAQRAGAELDAALLNTMFLFFMDPSLAPLQGCDGKGFPLPEA